MSIYDFEVKDTQGNMVSLSEYKGKVLLIVNSATKCGFTPQYTELNEIFNEFKDEGFVILDFPCNQFGNQAPGTGEEIAATCRSEYLVPYPIFEKIFRFSSLIFVMVIYHNKSFFINQMIFFSIVTVPFFCASINTLSNFCRSITYPLSSVSSSYVRVNLAPPLPSISIWSEIHRQ